MFNYDPNSLDLAKQYNAEQIQYAENYRQAQQLRQPSTSAKVAKACMSLLGKKMIAIGESLQEQPIQPTPKNTISRPV